MRMGKSFRQENNEAVRPLKQEAMEDGKETRKVRPRVQEICRQYVEGRVNE